MKTAAFFAIILAVSIFPQHVRTTLRQPTFTGDVRSFSIAGNTMYVIGYNLSVNSFTAKSTDQGLTWKTLPSPSVPEENLEAISFPTEQTGFIGGSNGAIYKTTNGGANWVSVADTNVYNGGINTIYFLNRDTGIVAGSLSNNTHLMRTTNGGQTWTAITTGATNQIYDLLFLNDGRVWATCSSGKFLYSTDYGTTWVLKSLTNTSTSYHIRRADENTFYMTGTLGTVAKSTDGGLTFINTTTGVSSTFYTLEFFDANNGWVFGTNGNTYFTTNGGASWAVSPAFTNEVIRTSVFAYGKVFAGAYKSTVAMNTGMTPAWKVLTTESRDYYGICVESPAAFAIAGDRGMVQTTSNAGGTWKKSAFMSGTLMYDVYKKGLLVYICGRNGEFHRSSDGGATWNSQSLGTSTTRLYKFFFFDQDRGYMISNEGNVHYTANGGVVWSLRGRIGTNILYDMKMLNDTLGFVSGSGDGIFATTNGTAFAHGTMFTPGKQMTALAMLSPAVGYIAGENGVVYKTTNGFQTATLMTDTIALQGKLIHDIVAFDENNVWAVGQGGVILRTVNASQMAQVDTAAADLYGAAKLNGASFLCTGAGGFVYKISTEVVPVELTSFTAQKAGRNVIVRWTTATEKNNRGFEVQTSPDGSRWNTAGFVPGQGTKTVPSLYEFMLNNIPADVRYLRLNQLDYDGSATRSETVALEQSRFAYELLQNYPNPFNPVTKIVYTLENSGRVSLKVFDILGKERMTLVNEEKDAGKHEISLNASSFPSGMYFYELQVNNFRAVKRMLLVR